MPKHALICVSQQPTVLEKLRFELNEILRDEAQIIAIASGKAALTQFTLLEQQGYDIVMVFADALLAEMPGEEFLSQVHQRSPQTLTGLIGKPNLAAVARALREAQLYRLLPTPWLPEELQASVLEGIQLYLQTKEAALTAAKTALYKTEAQFCNLVDNLHVGILVHNSRTEILLSNPRALELLGLTEAQILGKTAFNADWSVIQEDGSPFPRTEYPVNQAIATRQPVHNVVMGFYRPQTDPLAEQSPQDLAWLLVNAEPQLATDHTVEQVIVTFTDISEQIRAEAKLQAAKLALLQQAQRDRALNKVFQSIRNTLDLDEIFAIAAAEIVQLLHTDSASILQYFPARNCWQQIAKYYSQMIDRPLVLGSEIPDAGNPIASQLKQRQVVRIDNANMLTDQVNRVEAQNFPGAWLIVPLIVQDQVWGCFTTMKELFPVPWTDEEVDLAKVVADQLAIAIQQSLLFKQLQQELVDRKTAEAAQLKSEALFASAFHSSPDPIYMASLTEGRFVKVNDSFCLVSGFSQQEVVGQTCADLDFWADAQDRDRVCNQLKEAGAVRNYEFRFRTKAGEVRTGLLASEAITLNQEIYAFCMMKDISDRKAVEAEILRTSSRLSTLIESIQAGVLLEDETGQIALVNQIFCDLFGITTPPQALIGADCAQAAQESKSLFVHPEKFVGRLKTILQQQQIVVNEELSLADGRTFERDYVPIHSSGNYLGHLWKYRDISDRKAAQQALQERERHYRSLVNHIPGAVFRCGVDADATSHYLSDQFEEMTGYPVTDFVNNQVRTYNSIIHPDDLSTTDAAIEEAISQNQPYEIKYRIIDAQGNLRWLLEKGQVVPSLPRQPQMVEGVIIDITQNMQQEAERIQAETQLQIALKEKTTLLQEVHHRVKNNLQVISSLLKLQARRVNDPQVQQVLEDSQNRIVAMSLVHQHLYMGNNFSEVDFQEYIRTLTNHFVRSSHLNHAKVELETEVDPEILLPLDQAIPCSLIINELMTNALKHGLNQGKLSGKISVIMTQAQNQQVTLIVRNQGSALPTDFNINQSTSMGLKLVKILAEQLNATLTWKGGDTTSFCLSFERRR